MKTPTSRGLTSAGGLFAIQIAKEGHEKTTIDGKKKRHAQKTSPLPPQDISIAAKKRPKSGTVA